MTDSARDALAAAAGNVSRETYLALKAFEALFLKWNERINLASRSTTANLWERHILDSAQLVRLAPQATRWVDVGSGGGFPGVILAILMKERNGGHVDLVESNAKKAAFLRAAIAETGAPARVHAARIEAVHDAIVGPDRVTARALAPLPNLLELTAGWLQGGSTGLFHKGREYRAEVEESVNQWAFDLIEHPSRLEADSVILEIRSLKRRDQPR